MTAVSRDTLKGYFTVGSVVDESKMIDLIDSFENHVNNEEYVSIVVDAPTAGDKLILWQADRTTVIDLCMVTNDEPAANVTYQIKRNSGGVITPVTASGTTYGRVTTATSFPDTSIISGSVIAGDIIFVEITASTATTATNFLIGYADA